ncbi:molybdopterin molybdotransferase MoeA [Gluconacetobacter sp. 1c LMG 22058]|uniref:Molybdopterin molybdenumtransferase n=1 Tax=Gluconacetobacter dulcium TaxID=2729096 RepID=A0A7W4PIU3_9PROT|nr:molybdopterin molybdotransferase MoeA [Gluconacetobacter dulcium]MBB2199165.1 molybdopterin molybdotransferase MoeA [Gluconacetobacter dulcium]
MEPCFAAALRYDDALVRLMRRAADIRLASEAVPVGSAVGRVLAHDLHASAPRPAGDLSAMDGFAIRGGIVGMSLRIAGTTHAGQACATLPSGTAWRVLTGAPVPHGADRVVPREHTNSPGEATVELAALPALGAHIRRRGEEFAEGALLIPAGTQLDWRHLALCIAQGAVDIEVRARPRVAIVSSGAELTTSGGGSAIPDSNAPMLGALLAREGTSVTSSLTLADDDRTALADHLGAVAPAADLVVTTGGVSASETDHTPGALADLGAAILFRGVALRPGRPATVASLGATTIFALPGNPLAAALCAVTLVVPFLRALAGRPHPAARGRLTFTPQARAETTTLCLVRTRCEDGMVTLEPVPTVGAADISALAQADGVLPVPASGGLAAGDIVTFMPL